MTLRDSYALIERARRDLHALEAKTGPYVDSDPNELVMEPNKERTMYEVRLKQIEEPDVDWGIDFGVIGNHLRSALDYIPAYLANPADPGLSNTQFPIYQRKSDYLRKNNRGVTNRDRMLNGVPGPLKTIFDQQQPYARRDDPENGPLSLLVWISNRHKHRKLHPALVTVTQGRFIVSFAGVETIEVGIEKGTSLGGFNAKEYLFGVTPNRPGEEIEIKANLTTAIGFGDRSLNTWEVGPIIDRVQEVVDIFDPLAPTVP